MQTQINFSDVILIPQQSIVNSRSECDTSAVLGQAIFAVPLCAANMKSLITYDLCKLFDDYNWFYVYHRIDGVSDIANFIERANKDQLFCISISIGIQPEFFSLLRRIKESNWKVDFITIDIAHSHTARIIPFVEFIKTHLPRTYLIVGNGCTPEWIRFLENLGVDCAKVGIGVSQSCRTRQYTGFGSSTFSSLLECKAATHHIKLMSDGGITIKDNDIWIGDCAKAITAGADFIMSGSLFSRCIDSPAIINGYFGNASEQAKQHRNHVEGTTLEIKTNGLTTLELMKLVKDSLRSSISYAGGNKLMDLRKVKWTLQE